MNKLFNVAKKEILQKLDEAIADCQQPELRKKLQDTREDISKLEQKSADEN